MVRKLLPINESVIGSEPEGRAFETLRAHHCYQAVAAKIPIAELGPLGPTVRLSPPLLDLNALYLILRVEGPDVRGGQGDFF